MSLRRLDPDAVTFTDDAHRMAAMQIAAFGGGPLGDELLERSGLVPVTTTTPFVWQRDPTSA